MRRISQTVLLFGVLFVAAGALLPAADVEIRPFEFVTRVHRVDDGTLGLQTFGDLGLTLRSGFLARPSVTLGIQSEAFDDPAIPIIPLIRSASVEMRELGGTELSVSYFVGEFDRLGTGDEFPRRFGTDPVSTRFRGFMYFPDGPRFEGMYGVSGTGLAVSTNDQWNRAEFSAYTYQDNRFDPGVFSSDIQAMLNFDAVQLEAFVGATYPLAAVGRYRAGVLANLRSPQGDSLLLQVALPAIEPATGEEISVNDFYFLFEPRVRLGMLGTTLSFFWQPDVYDQIATGQGGSIDTNLRLELGDIRNGDAAAGVETRLAVRPDADEQFLFSTTPFVQLSSGGVTWEIRTQAKLIPYDPTELFEGYIGVRTEF